MKYYLTRIPSTDHQNLSRIPIIPDRSPAHHLIFFGKPKNVIVITKKYTLQQRSFKCISLFLAV